MSGSSSVLTDNSALSRADQLLQKLEIQLTTLGGIIIFLLVFLATANILGRWIFDTPISGYIDWVEQSMAFFAFLGIAYTQRNGGHIRMDIVVSHLHGRALWVTEFISTFLMFLLTLVLIYGSYLHFLRAYQLGDSSIDINLPTWPSKLVVTFALTMLAVRFLLQLWGYIRAIKEGGDRPVAVPLIEDAATVAANEAKSIAGDDIIAKQEDQK